MYVLRKGGLDLQFDVIDSASSVLVKAWSPLLADNHDKHSGVADKMIDRMPKVSAGRNVVDVLTDCV
jgi:hypothetical protein